MSQRGAMQMAKSGYTYDQILGFYYEGCERVAFTLTRSASSPGGNQQTVAEQPAPLETPAPEAPVQARVTTQSGSLNLRQSPNRSAKGLRTTPQYALTPVYEQSGAWCRTVYNGMTGYVMASYLTFPGQPAATPAPVAENAPAAQYARVTTQKGSLNLRQSPGSSAKVLGTIPQYETIPILERGTAWCRTSYGGAAGYVMTRFLTFPDSAAPALSPAPVPTASPAQPDGVSARVTTPGGSLNLRQSPSSSAKVLRTIPQNDLVAVLQKGPDWCQVAYAGTIGYVMTKYLYFDTAASIPTAAPAVTAPPASNDGLRPLDVPILARIMPTSSSLNLRDGCSTGAIILMEMPKFDTLIITAVGDTWCAVNYNGLSGYCMTKYLEFEWYE
jgi:uncharacterized protein YraI